MKSIHIIIVSTFLIIAMGSILYTIDKNSNIIVGDCFDRYNNKIIEVTCETKVNPTIESMGIYGDLGIGAVVGVLILSIIAFIFVSIFKLNGVEWDD